MDFVIGVLLFMVLLLLLFNFASISISDSNVPNSEKCLNQNFLFSSKLFNTSTPSPVPSVSQTATKSSLNNSKYDYNKYFFVN